ADALRRVSVNQMDNLEQLLTEDLFGLQKALPRLLPSGGDLLLFIDQFEEIFTQTAVSARGRFLSTLMNALQTENSQLHLIVTLRADYYDRPLMFTDFGNLLRKHTEVVLPLNRDELEQAIINPLERVGASLAPGLLNLILNDSIEQPGALPLLQYALTELFER